MRYSLTGSEKSVVEIPTHRWWRVNFLNGRDTPPYAYKGFKITHVIAYAIYSTYAVCSISIILTVYMCV